MGYFKTLGRALVGKRMSAYDAASTSRRLATWVATGEHLNSLLTYSGDTIRARSRDSVRQNAWMAAGIDDWVNEAIGTGGIPHPQHSSPEKRARLTELWKRFVDEADAAGSCNLYGLQALAFRGVLEGGETFTRFRPRRPEDGLTVPLQLQVLEGEHVPLEKNESNGANKIRCGIEFTPFEKRVAYHMYRAHPGDSTITANDLTTARVPAETVLHEYHVRRPGLIRGEPWTVRALIKAKQLSRYDDAQTEKQVLSACMAGFIEPPANEDLILPADDSIAETGETPATGEALTRLAPGTFPVVPVDGKITIAQGTDVGATYEVFVKSQLRMIARALGVTYEALTGDLSGVNYSSIRAGVVKFRRACRVVQENLIIFQWSRPVWRAFIEACVLAGHIPASDYRANQREYLNVIWMFQKWEWIDPLKDVQADKVEVEAGFASRSEKIAERGRDAEEVDLEIARDQKRAETLGIVFGEAGATLIQSATEEEEARNANTKE